MATNPARVTDVLNELMLIHACSLPMYLRYAAPWIDEGEERETQALRHIIADQQRIVDRIGHTILDFEGDVESAEFPLVYTGYNDLSFDFLLPKLIEHQKRDVRAIQSCVEQLSHAPLARAVGEEALGMAKGHLETLEEVAEEVAQQAVREKQAR